MVVCVPFSLANLSSYSKREILRKRGETGRCLANELYFSSSNKQLCSSGSPSQGKMVSHCLELLHHRIAASVSQVQVSGQVKTRPSWKGCEPAAYGWYG